MNLLQLLLLLVAGLVLWLAITIALTWRLLTRPQRKGYGWALGRNLPGEPGEANFPQSRVEEWTVRSRGVDLPVWSILNEARPNGRTIVITHAWGESRVGALAWAEAVYPFAGRVVLWDLPGHGEAGGWSTLGLREPEDLQAVIESLCDEPWASGTFHSDRTIWRAGRPPHRSIPLLGGGAGVPPAIARRPTSHGAAGNPEAESAESFSPEAQRRASAPPTLVLLGLSMGAGVSIAAAANLADHSRQIPNPTDRFSTADTRAPSRPLDTTNGVSGPAIAGVIAVGPPRKVMDAARRLIRQVGLPWLAGGLPAMQLLALRLGRLGWFDRIEPARRLAVPLLVLTGSADLLCLPAEGRSLAEAAKRGRFVELPNIRHGEELRSRGDGGEAGASRSGNPSLAAIADFLESLQ